MAGIGTEHPRLCGAGSAGALFRAGGEPVGFLQTALEDSAHYYLQTAPLGHVLHRAAEVRGLIGCLSSADCVNEPEGTGADNAALQRPVLDVGCGRGEFARAALAGPLDVGLDISTRQLRLAHRTGRYRQLERADARRMPFADQSFQTVLSISVLEHIVDAEKVVAEVFRVLRPGGIFLCTLVLADFNQMLFYPRLLRRLKLHRAADVYCRGLDRLFDHRTMLTQAAWEEIFARSGFEIAASRRAVFPRVMRWYDLLLPLGLPYKLLSPLGIRSVRRPRWWQGVLGRLVRRLLKEERPDLGSNLVLVARKP